LHRRRDAARYETTRRLRAMAGYAGLPQLLPGLSAHHALDLIDDSFGLVTTAVGEQPARALGHMPYVESGSLTAVW
jgi:hypothetical protein